MCGIAGYSLHPASRIDRTLAAQALLAGIAERGADAAGYAWRAPGTPVAVRKERSGASEFLELIALPDDATEALVHVRAYTRGHPAVAANNHPVRHRSIVGVHNGTIENDEAVFAWLGRERHAPEMSVDSEAIFALADASDSSPRALERLRGSMATAWIDERERGVLHLARGSRRPLWLGRTPREIFFASTRHGLTLLARTLRLRLRVSPMDEGVAIALAAGRTARCRRFSPDRRFADDRLPNVRAPHEARRCRHRLASLATGAAAEQ